MPVWLAFYTSADWQVYGPAGAGSYRRYIRPERIPADYPYTAMDQTGFGGILLVCDFLGEPVAYDLACPVECRNNVLISVDPQENVAVCHTCGSRYDIFSNYGNPLSGPAATKKYGLTQYSVLPAMNSGIYMLVTRR